MARPFQLFLFDIDRPFVTNDFSSPNVCSSFATFQISMRASASHAVGANSTLKTRLRLLIYSHFLLATLVVTQLITFHFSLINTMNIPRPHLWQYIWLVSVIPSICALLALRRHQFVLMKIFFHGNLLFGLVTIGITILLNLSDLFTYKRLKVNQQLNDIETQTFLGFPLLVLWYIFLMITVQIHGFSLHTAHVLMQHWPMSMSTKRQ
jgi:hypothetical protein